MYNLTTITSNINLVIINNKLSIFKSERYLFKGCSMKSIVLQEPKKHPYWDQLLELCLWYF
jgi:hypothetical protein